MINAARIIPVMYQGIFRRCIITRQNTYEVIVSRNGIKRRLRSPRSSGLKPLILRNRKMVSVGIRMVKQYTTPSTINLYCIGMMRRYEKRNRIRNARNGMENGVNIADITRAVRIKVLSATICCSSTILIYNFTIGFINHLTTLSFYNYFLSLATGMFNCCLYLATVRRAIGYPFSFSISVSSSSV